VKTVVEGRIQEKAKVLELCYPGNDASVQFELRNESNFVVVRPASLIPVSYHAQIVNYDW